MALKNLIIKEPELTAWVEYKNGLRFQLRYISRHELRRLGETCQIIKFDPVTKSRMRQIDPERFANEYCKKVVVGWDGVSLQALSLVIPLNLEGVPAEKLKEPIPFNIEDMQDLIKQAFELDAFIQDASTDLSVFRPDKEEVEKNSETSPSGN